MKVKDLAVEHDYYCSDNNYYIKESGLRYDNFDCFLDDFKDADIDMNLVFRWDIKEHGDHHGYYLELFMIKQRKGIFCPITFCPIWVKEVTDTDVPNIVEYLKSHLDKLKSIWQPLK